jgi:hypothetical protein
MPRGSPLRRIRRFPGWKLRLLPEAIFWLLIARLALLLVPFPKIARYLGTLQAPGAAEVTADAAGILLARRVGQAIDTAADYAPLPLVCLPRALAGWQMLHRRGIPSRLHFGALRESHRDPSRPGIQTHAWLSSSGAEITGYPVAHGCVELGYFARPSSHVRHERDAGAMSR